MDLGVHRRRCDQKDESEPRQSFIVPLWFLRSSCQIPGPPPALSHRRSQRPTVSVNSAINAFYPPIQSFLFSPPLTYPPLRRSCHPQGTPPSPFFFQTGPVVVRYLSSVLRKTKKRKRKKKIKKKKKPHRAACPPGDPTTRS